MAGYPYRSTARGIAPSRVYEDFEPTLEWVKEDDAETLLVFLPGFQKEMLNVKIIKDRNLKVSGERHIGERIWRRFTKEFPIIPNCDTNHIVSKFDSGRLFVKLPKKEAPPSPSRATPHVKLPDEAATSAIRKTEDKLAEDKIPSARVSQQKEGHDDKRKVDASHDVHKKASKDEENKTSGSEKASKEEENKTSAGVAKKGKREESEAMKKYDQGKHVSESVEKEKEEKEKSKPGGQIYREKFRQSGEGSFGARQRSRPSFKDRAQVPDMGFKINPRKVVNLGLIALFLLVLVLYVKNTFKSIEESTIGEL